MRRFAEQSRVSSWLAQFVPHSVSPTSPAFELTVSLQTRRRVISLALTATALAAMACADMPPLLENKSGIAYQDKPMSEVVAQSYSLRALEPIIVAGGLADLLNEEGPFTALLPQDVSGEELPQLRHMMSGHVTRYWRDHFAEFMYRHISRDPILNGEGQIPEGGTRITLTMMDGSELYLETAGNRQYYWEGEPARPDEPVYTLAQVRVTNGVAFNIEKALSVPYMERSIQDAVGLLDSSSYSEFKALFECFLSSPDPADQGLVDAMTAHIVDSTRAQGLTVLAPTNSALGDRFGPDFSPTTGCAGVREQASRIVRSHILEATLSSSFFGTGAAMNMNTALGSGITRITLPEVPEDACDGCGVVRLMGQTSATTIDGDKVLALSGVVYGIDKALTPWPCERCEVDGLTWDDERYDEIRALAVQGERDSYGSADLRAQLDPDDCIGAINFIRYRAWHFSWKNTLDESGNRVDISSYPPIVENSGCLRCAMMQAHCEAWHVGVNNADGEPVAPRGHYSCGIGCGEKAVGSTGGENCRDAIFNLGGSYRPWAMEVHAHISSVMSQSCRWAAWGTAIQENSGGGRRWRFEWGDDRPWTPLDYWSMDNAVNACERSCADDQVFYTHPDIDTTLFTPREFRCSDYEPHASTTTSREPYALMCVEP